MPEFPTSVIKLVERGGDPGAVADKGKVYTKNVGGVTQLFYEASNGAVVQAAPVLPGAGTIAFSQQTTLFTLGPGNTVPAATLTNVFTTPRDEATLAANSTYHFTANYIFTNSPTASSFTIQFGGTATFATFEYIWDSWANAGREYGFSQVATALSMYSNTRSTPYIITLEGTIRTINAGTVIPQITMTAGAATATIVAGSYFEIVYLGPDTFVSQGGWG